MSGVGVALEGGFRGGFFFALHILVLDGVEDIATGLALNVLGVFIAGDDAHNGVFAGGRHGECVGRCGRD